MTTPALKWRDDLHRVRIAVDGRTFDAVGASFRGAPFFVETVELSTGRRIVVHEFPLRDDPFVEDLGRKGRRFRLDGYVIGSDYQPAKNALLTALEGEGPGKLVLPYYDVKRAIPDTVTVRETKSDGGMAAFSIEFVETPAQAPTPTIDPDPVGQVGVASDAAEAAISTQLVQDFDVQGLAAFALTSASNALTKAAAAVQAKLAPLVTDAQELAGLNGQLSLLTAQASALVRQPLVMVGQFLTAISSLSNTAASSPGAVFNALVDAYHADLGTPVIATTATRIRELANQQALQGALKRVMAIEAARLAPTIAFASIEDAMAARDAIAGVLDEQAQGAGDTAYPALVELRAQVLRAVPGASVFARITTVTRRVAIPSLLLAYQLYGSIDQEADIIARNPVAARHPGFVAGDLKVLSAVG